VQKTRKAIASGGAKRQAQTTGRTAPDSVVAIEVAFLEAEARGTLARAVRKTVRGNPSKALQAV
jgi:hypothetical protein